jgi:uncharacterized protein YndB with AHSA1/START domain
MESKNTKTIELKKEISASPEDVFNAIKLGALLTSTGVKAGSFKIDFKESGSYSLEWNSGGFCKGRFTQIIPNKSVVFTWHSTGCKSGTNKDTIVSVTLTGNENRCTLRLIHEGLDSGFSYEDHYRGWSSSLEDFQKGF